MILHCSSEGDTITGVKKYIFLSLFVAVFSSALLVMKANAQTADTVTPEMVGQHCSQAQSYLKTIQKPNDLRARVDRLQAYTYIYQRMDIFVERLEHNKQPLAQQFRENTDSLQSSIGAFKRDYESYDVARDRLTDLKNCQKNVSEFQHRLDDAREKRTQVNTDITKLDQLLGPTFQTQLTDLYQQLSPPVKSEGQS